ncbi:MAG: aconitase family protein, partial [Planctomycetota bacterium]
TSKKLFAVLDRYDEKRRVLMAEREALMRDLRKAAGKAPTSDAEVDALQAYFKAQQMYGVPKAGAIDYSENLELDLSSVFPSLAGPKRPQDRINLDQVKRTFTSLFSKPVGENGFNKNNSELAKKYKAYDGLEISNGDVLIAAITSCTNTSNPGVLLAAGLLAKKAVELGLTVKPHIKTSLAPGSRVVTEYLTRAGLLPYLEKLGFYLAGYGCTTCIGNAGPLSQPIEETIVKNELVCAAVLSGNRNFEARIHPNIRANFLASPPLVVAYAIAGTVLTDFKTQPIGRSKDGQDVFIGHIWPSADEVQSLMKLAMDAPTFRRLYGDLANASPMFTKISAPAGQVYSWPKSSYIAEPPFFKDFGMQPGRPGNISGARVLGVFGDSVTTDHISPAGSIKPTSPAG